MEKDPNMKYLSLIILFSTLPVSTISLGNTLINDMQACQALNQFVINKLEASVSPYTAEKVGRVTKGLKMYNEFIQDEIVSPGLLKFNGGDKARTDVMQQQVDAYKAKLISGLASRYSTNKMLTDYAVSINNCTQKARPKGETLEALKVSVTSLMELVNDVRN